MKDLFTGSLGRLNNHGGSKIYTTPNTILVPPEYEIDTHVPADYEFVTCSLDGRLWAYKRKNLLCIIALKWNEEIEKLEFADSKIMQDEEVINKGLNWILTDKSIIQILENANNIQYKNIEHQINSVEQFYSLLPNIENWNIIKNRLISATHGIFPLTSLEFNYYSEDNIEVYTGINPYLIYFNGKIWGRGISHIGIVYLLPKTFNENGEIEEYYLYISPNYTRSYDNGFNDNDGWSNMGIAPINKNSLCGFNLKQNNKGLCVISEDTNIYLPATKEWINLSENEGNIFFDIYNNSGLIIENNKIKLLPSKKTIEANGISQWIAPAKQIENISDDMIISSSDNHTLVTYLDKGLYREKLQNRKLYLTPITYTKNDNSNIRLSLGEKEKIIEINNFFSNKHNINIEWKDIYKDFIKINLLNMKPMRNSPFWVHGWDIGISFFYQIEKYPIFLCLDNTFYQLTLIYFNPQTEDMDIIDTSFPLGYRLSRAARAGTMTFTLKGNKIHFTYEIYGIYDEGFFDVEISEKITNFTADVNYHFCNFDTNLAFVNTKKEGIVIDNIIIDPNEDRIPYAVFHYLDTNIYFYCHIFSYQEKISYFNKTYPTSYGYDYYNSKLTLGVDWYDNIFTFNIKNNNDSIKKIHGVACARAMKTFKSELNPEIFDLDTELQRSIPH